MRVWVKKGDSACIYCHRALNINVFLGFLLYSVLTEYQYIV